MFKTYYYKLTPFICPSFFYTQGPQQPQTQIQPQPQPQPHPKQPQNTMYPALATVCSLKDADSDIIYYYGKKYRSDESFQRILSDVNQHIEKMNYKLEQCDAITTRLQETGCGRTTITPPIHSENIVISVVEEDTQSMASLDDYDNESISGMSNSTAQSSSYKKGNVKIGKQYQKRYLPDGTLLRHDVLDINNEQDSWFGVYDAERNVIIRENENAVSVGVEYETLHQFAIAHTNEAKNRVGSTENVWSDGHLKYMDRDDGCWYSIGDLRGSKK